MTQPSITTLVSFSSGADPASAPVMDAAGNLYGTTYTGGSGAGSIYEISAATGSLTTLYSFSYATPSSSAAGLYPLGGLTLTASGDLVGMTEGGGNTNGNDGDGTLFEFSPTTLSLTTLVTFDASTTGNGPTGKLIADAAGNLYGATGAGGVNAGGTVFEIAATGSLSVLASIGSPAGYFVTGMAMDAAGDLFGTTLYGGANNSGSVFEVVAGTQSVSVIASFSGTSGVGDLTVDAAGDLFGMTTTASSSDPGAVFEIAAGTSSITTLASFNAATTGSQPNGAMLLDAAGNLFGTTISGGPNGYGTVFEVSAATHSLTTVASFNLTDGAGPDGGLLAGANGLLYGATGEGGASSGGTVFAIANSGFVFSLPPTITVALLHDTGASATDGITADDALIGTGDANATMTISNGATVLGTTTADASGNWNFTPSGLADGAYTLTVSETIASGTATLSFALDTAAPAPTIAIAHDTGASSSDNITSNDALSGSGDANATVTISDAAGNLGTTTADALGAWSYTPTGLADGTYNFTASETDTAGNTGTASIAVTLDSAAPDTTIGLAHDTGASSSDTITSNDALTGSGDANATVTISDAGGVLHIVTADGTGAWAYTPSGLADGTYIFTASETDTAGNTGTASIAVTLDTTAPVTTIALAHDTGSSASDNITSNDALSGSGDANAVVTISDAAGNLGTTTADALGAWSYTPSGLADGSYNFTASETDTAGNTGTASIAVTLRAAAPGVTTSGNLIVDAQNPSVTLATATGPQGDAIAVRLTGDAAFGTAGASSLTLNGGTVVYTAGTIIDALGGLDTITYTVTDTLTGVVTSAIQSVRVETPDDSWVGTSGDWMGAAHWSTGATPTADETAIIGNGAVATLAAGETGLAATTSILSGGTLDVSGTLNVATVSNGGSLYVNSGGVANGVQIATGGFADVQSGGVATGIVIKGGALMVGPAGVASATVISSGSATLASGGTATSTTILAGTSEIVLSGGSETGAVVSSGGMLAVYAGGTIAGASLLSGGTIDLPGFAYGAGETVAFNYVTDRLTIAKGHSTISENLAGNYAHEAFSLVADGTGGTDIVIVPAPTPVVTVTLDVRDGLSLTNIITNSAAISGTADANATVVVSNGGTVLGNATADASGNWSYAPSGLANGLIDIVATDTNPASNTGTATTSYTLDTTAGLAFGALTAQAGNDNAAYTPFAALALSDGHVGATESVTITLSNAAHGVLSNLGGGTYTTSTGIYTVSGSLASVQAALQGLIFTPAFGASVSTSFALTGDDGIFRAATTSTSVSVTHIAGSTAEPLVLKPGDNMIGNPGSLGFGTLELAAGGIGDLTGLGSAITGVTKVIVDNGATWDLTGSNTLSAGESFITTGTGTIDNTGTLYAKTTNGTVTFGAGITFDNTGVINVCVNDPLVIYGALTGMGTVTIGTNAEAEFNAAVASGQAVVFTDGTGIVQINDRAAFAGTISGLQSGDVIDLTEIAPHSVADLVSVSGHNLVITMRDGTTDSIAVDPGVNLATLGFGLSADGTGGIDLTATGAAGVMTATSAIDVGPSAAHRTYTWGYSLTTDVTSLIDTAITAGIAAAGGLTGDTLTITSLTATHGVVSGTGLIGTTIDYTTPTATAPTVGSDTITFTVQDQFGNSATNSVTVTVDPGPVANTGTYTNGHDQTVTSSLTTYILGLVHKGLPADTETITAVSESAGAGDTADGSISVDAVGHVTYTLPQTAPETTPLPSNGIAPVLTIGTATITYTVTDQYLHTATNSFTVVVDPGPSIAVAAPVISGNVAVSLFNGIDAAGNHGLWITTGTPQGTRELTGIVGAAANLNPLDLTWFNSEILFSGTDSGGHVGLWISNGTAAGTTELAVTAPSNIFDWVSQGHNEAVFQGGDGGLWLTDGTAAGTREVTGITDQSYTPLGGVGTTVSVTAGSAVSALDPAYFAWTDQGVMFAGTDSSGKADLWLSDGTAAGTYVVPVAGASATGLNPTDLLFYHNKVWFSGTDAAGHTGLWAADGTTHDTSDITVAGAGANLNPTDLTEVNDRLVFFGTNSGGQLDLWSSDGTAAGTSELHVMGLTVPANMVVFNWNDGALFDGRAMFTVSGHLWITDGTAGGTSELAVAGLTGPTDLQVLGNRVVFSGTDALGHVSLWSSDGTAGGTYEEAETTNQNVASTGLGASAIANLSITVANWNYIDANSQQEFVIGSRTAGVIGTTRVGLLADVGSLSVHGTGLVAGASLSLGAIGGGVYDILYNAPTEPAGGTWNNDFTFNVTDEYGDVSLNGTATVLIDPGPQTASGSYAATTLGACNLTALVQSLTHIGMDGDIDTITSASAATGFAHVTQGQVTYFAPESGADTLTVTVTDQYGTSANVTIAIGNVGSNGTEPVISGTGNLTATGWYDTVIESAYVAGGVTLTGQHNGDTFIDLHNNTDTINASGNANRIITGAGNDVINAGGQGCYIDAGDGNNTINVGYYSNTIVVGNGNSTITGVLGDSTLYAADGNQTVTMHGNFNVLQIGNGLQHIFAGDGNAIVMLGNSVGGTSTIDAGGYWDTIIGGDGDFNIGSVYGDSTIDLGVGNHTITLAGDYDVVTLGSGNNTISNPGECSTITLLDGSQTLTVNGENSVYTLGTGTHVIDAGGGWDSRWNIGDGTLTMLNVGDANTIVVGLGDTLINATIAAGGANGANNNIRIVDDGLYNVTIGQNGTLIVGNSVGGMSTLTATAYQALIVGQDGNFVVNGIQGDSNVTLGIGNHTITASGDDNMITLGDGANVINSVAGKSTLALGNGNQTITLSSTYNVITAGTGNDTLTLSGGFETITLGAGNDTIADQGGDETITIASGNEIFSGAFSLSTITLGAGTDHFNMTGSGNHIAIASGNETFVLGANAGQNTLVLGDGNDTISGGGGNETITIGSGAVGTEDDATITLGGLHNSITLENFGTDNINLGNAGFGTLTMLGTVTMGATSTIVTGAGNDIITGAAGNYVATLAGGWSTLTLGAGNDALTDNGNNDWIVLGAGNSNLGFTGIGLDSIAIGAGNETVVLAGNSNTLTLAAGTSSVDFGSGWYDTVSMLAAGSLSLAHGGIGEALSLGVAGSETDVSGNLGAQGTLTMHADGVMALTIGLSSHLVLGNSLGASSIAATGDWQFITGGNGNFAITGLDTGSVLNLGSGTDTVGLVGSSETVTLGNGTNIVTGGTGADMITVGDGTNHVTTGGPFATILAGSGTNTISATGGNSLVATSGGTSTVTVGNGGNVINLGDGTAATHDTVIGSAGGGDQVQFTAANKGLVELTNFLANTDELDITRTLAGLNLAGGAGAYLSSTQSGGNTNLFVDTSSIGGGVYKFGQLDGVSTTASQLLIGGNFKT